MHSSLIISDNYFQKQFSIFNIKFVFCMYKLMFYVCLYIYIYMYWYGAL